MSKEKSKTVTTQEAEEEVYPLVYNMWITINQAEGSSVVINQTGKPVNPPPTSP